MSTFVFDCPNCAVRNSTFKVKSWDTRFEDECLKWSFFSICRACTIPMIIQANVLTELYDECLGAFHTDSEAFSELKRILLPIIEKDEGHLNEVFENFTYNPILASHMLPPEHVPEEIKNIFIEASKCLSLSCFNATAAMFRLCLDRVTKEIVNQNIELSPTQNDKKSIHNRLTWIFDKNILNRDLEELSRCIKDDGNDGAHDGNIGKDEAEDLFDFTYEFLETVYTKPARVRNATERRQLRRQG